MERQLADFLRRELQASGEITIEGLEQVPGGFSRETFRFDAIIGEGDGSERMAFILRKDPPAAAAILHTSRADEHALIEAIRSGTGVPVSRSYGFELDPSIFGEAAMVIERMAGSGQTSDLFHGGRHEHQADDVMRHLCEVLVELHTADIDAIGVRQLLGDPRGVGIDTSSWDSYMDSTCEYYLRSFDQTNFDPGMAVYLDAYLTLRRSRPRPLPLALVHGDFNPANFLYEDGRVTALIDWENSRIGDPREDLGWMVAMDQMSNTNVMAHPADEGGFLAYYNKLTGGEITPEELGYFMLFGTANIAVPVVSAVSRRLNNEHHQFLPLYILQASAPNLVGFAAMLQYPGVS